jgi:hypothetical protein
MLMVAGGRIAMGERARYERPRHGRATGNGGGRSQPPGHGWLGADRGDQPASQHLLVFVNPEWPTLMLGSGPPSVSF